MPNNDFDSQAMLNFVSELSKRVEDLKSELASISNQAGTGMRKVTDETQKLGDVLEDHAKSMEGLKEQTGGLLNLIRGPVGLAAGFVAASKAMESFVVGELQLRNFATDVGLTSASVAKLRVQLQASGIDSKTADQQISSLNAHLNDLKTYQTTSKTYRELAINDKQFADNLLAAEKAGDRLKSIQLIQEKNNREGPRSQLFMQDKLGVSASTLEALAKNTTGIHQPCTYDEGKLDEFNKNATNMYTDMQNAYGATMMYVVNETANFVSSTQLEFEKLSGFFHGLWDDFQGKGKPGSEVFGPKGILPNKEEFGGLFGPKGILPNTEELGGAWDWLKKNMSMEAHASGDTGQGTLLEGDASFSQRFGEWGGGAFSESITKDKLDVQKESNKALQDIRDIIQGNKEVGGGVDSMASGPASPGAPGGKNAPGGPARLSDESGSPIDAETMKQATILGQAGDVAGLQKLFAARGYHVSGRYCGIIASRYVTAAGFKPPAGSAIATNWHNWGEGMTNPEDINKADAEHPMGSMVATYWHRRYGGNPNEILRPGAQGGHVMTIVPGTFDKKTGTVDVVDQYGFSHGKRNIRDMDIRYAGKEAVDAAAARRGEKQVARTSIDNSFPGLRKDSASVNVEFNNVPKGVKTNAELLDQGVFNTLNIKKSQQQASP